MKELIKAMRVVVDGEVARAMDRYGKGYASDHEGYGVLSEEIWEAEKEVRDFRRAQNLILLAIHEGDALLVRAACFGGRLLGSMGAVSYQGTYKNDRISEYARRCRRCLLRKTCRPSATT